MFVKIHNDGTYSELTESEFKADPSSASATVIRANYCGIFSTNPESSRMLDSQTPHVSARRFLQDLFRYIDFDSSCELAVKLIKRKETLFILK